MCRETRTLLVSADCSTRRYSARLGLKTADMNACIACGDDEYLNDASVRFHERMGFRFVGKFERCAYKFDRWYDMAWMQKPIGEHLQNQPTMRPFARFRDEICASAGIEI